MISTQFNRKYFSFLSILCYLIHVVLNAIWQLCKLVPDVVHCFLWGTQCHGLIIQPELPHNLLLYLASHPLKCRTLGIHEVGALDADEFQHSFVNNYLQIGGQWPKRIRNEHVLEVLSCDRTAWVVRYQSKLSVKAPPRNIYFFPTRHVRNRKWSFITHWYLIHI